MAYWNESALPGPNDQRKEKKEKKAKMETSVKYLGYFPSSVNFSGNFFRPDRDPRKRELEQKE